MSAKNQFEEAYKRLISGKGKIVKSGEPINISNVAKEAGRQRSALRAGRGFDDLIERIRNHTSNSEKKRTSNKQSRIERRIENDDARILKLETENSKLKSQNLSLLLKVYQLQMLINEKNIKPKKMAEVINISERVDGLEDGIDW